MWVVTCCTAVQALNPALLPYPPSGETTRPETAGAGEQKHLSQTLTLTQSRGLLLGLGSRERGKGQGSPSHLNMEKHCRAWFLRAVGDVLINSSS